MPWHTGTGGSGAKLLLQGLAGSSTAGGSVNAVDDDIVFGVFGHSARIAQVKAGRAWRKVGAMVWHRVVEARHVLTSLSRRDCLTHTMAEVAVAVEAC